MTTAQQVITGAMKDLGVISQTEAPEGQESIDALERLNFMCAGWIHDGIDMEWITLAALSTVVPYPEDQIAPIRDNLAMHLAPTFEVTPTPEHREMASNGYKQLQRQYLVIDEMEFDTVLSPYFSPNSYYSNGSSF